MMCDPGQAMNIETALRTRKSTRAFLDKPVSEAQLRRILDAARHAPSGANTQPWQVALVTGEKKAELGQRLDQAFRDGIKPAMDYQYYPRQWPEPYRTRRNITGVQLYRALHIEREDKQRRADQWAANYQAFGAPVVLFFFMDPVLETGSYMDYGTFLQSIMLLAVSEGLATCPQAALGEYSSMVKEYLGYPEDSILVCGMALGYEDRDAPVNSYRTAREDVDVFSRFFGFD